MPEVEEDDVLVTILTSRGLAVAGWTVVLELLDIVVEAWLDDEVAVLDAVNTIGVVVAPDNKPSSDWEADSTPSGSSFTSPPSLIEALIAEAWLLTSLNSCEKLGEELSVFFSVIEASRSGI